MESYQETVLSAMMLLIVLIESEISEFPVGAHLFIFTVSYLESPLIAGARFGSNRMLHLASQAHT